MFFEKKICEEKNVKKIYDIFSKSENSENLENSDIGFYIQRL